MPNHKNTSGMVGITLHLPLKMLEEIQQQQGKSQSEKIRLLLEKALAEKRG